ncbi:hypothetical protein [Micromonospora sp. NBC_01412]|uniref:hypothetical protein n=1 Tax=Micromonospora sp. NBC_01412 TaxID=2903590 RepID=UPI0032459774
MSSRELTSLRQRWTDYQNLSTLTEHWCWRPGWHAGRHFYTWHLTFQEQPALHHHVTDLQQQLAPLTGLDLVQLDGPWAPRSTEGGSACSQVSAGISRSLAACVRGTQVSTANQISIAGD